MADADELFYSRELADLVRHDHCRADAGEHDLLAIPQPDLQRHD